MAIKSVLDRQAVRLESEKIQTDVAKANSVVALKAEVEKILKLLIDHINS